ncbi:TPA: hypothetical protein UM349_000061 [Stenotrophomonas maltophilia]|nr:hypothetical protein [Stenotrophomonas maltophilia]
MEKIPEGCISRRDAVIASVIAGVFGAGMTLFFSGVLLLVFEETGNVADWAGAVGTWVIGYGAWRIARDGHEHRIRESNQRESRESEVRNAALWQMVVKATEAKTWPARVTQFATSPVEAQTLKALLLMIHVAIAALGRKTWSDGERAMLSQEGINALSLLEFELMAQLETLKAMHARWNGDASDYAKEREGIVALLVEMGERLSVDADQFIGCVRSLMTPWKPGNANH